MCQNLIGSLDEIPTLRIHPDLFAVGWAGPVGRRASDRNNHERRREDMSSESMVCGIKRTYFVSLVVAIILLWWLGSTEEDERLRQVGPPDAQLRPRTEEQLSTYLDVRLPGVTSVADEPDFCTSLRMPFDQGYIVGFSPLFENNPFIHHIVILQCEEPDMSEGDPLGFQAVWNCEVNSPLHADPKYRYGDKCKETLNSYLYGWELSPKSFFLPADTAFEVGAKTDRKYLILNVHFMKPVSTPDYSGMRIHLARERPKYRAGVMRTLLQSSVPPKSTFYNDYMCEIKGPGSYYPFAWWGHTHKLGRVVSALRVDPRDKTWHFIGRDKPYTKTNYIGERKQKQSVMNSNQLLAVRCTMVSDRNDPTVFDAHSHGEMCLLFLYFYTSQSDSVALPPSQLECAMVNEALVRDKMGYFPPAASEYEGVYYKNTVETKLSAKEELEARKLIEKY